MPNFIEVCSGAGGLSSGLIKAGFNPILLSDHDSDCCKTLKLNHKDCTILNQSFENIDFSSYKNIDLLAGGVPCQSFSVAGLRKGLDDHRGNLLLSFIDLIRTIKPKSFLIENVKGLFFHDNGNTLKIILEYISQIGLYNIECKVLDASKYEVPQKRERLFIVGVLKTLNKTFIFPEPSNKKILLKDILHNVPESPCANYTQNKIEFFKLIPEGGCWINLPEDKQKEYLGNCFYSGGGKRGILKRLSMEDVSLTILCSPSRKITERCHPIENRPLSIRESARIQTFDDSYEFAGGITSQYKQIGNAVPVTLAKKLGESLIKIL